MSATTSTDVLIVGAGPVGLTAAHELTRYGVSCRIIDQAEGTKEISKALILHVRTQEVFDAMGLSAELAAEVVPLKQVEVHAYGSRLGHWQLDGVQSPHSHPVIHGQNRTEHLLERAINAQDVRVQWRTGLASLQQDSEGITATVRHADGNEETVRARYVIGCDGSKSVVRQTLGIPFEGDHYTGEQFIQADAKISWTLPAGVSYLFLTKYGYMMVIEMPDGYVRVFISLPDTNFEDKSDPSLDDILKALREMGSPEAELSDPLWLSRYRTSHRTATHFREGRVFLAGDAGHEHVPIGGQGMNTGVQDAFNLSWKLASVIRGAAQPSLLDTYNIERHPIAQQLISGTDRAYRFVLSPDDRQQGLLQFLGPLVLQSDKLQNQFRETLEEVNIAYYASPLSEDHGGSSGPIAGQRALDAMVVRLSDRQTIHLYDALRVPRWSLLLFGGTRPTDETTQRLAQLGRAIQVRYGQLVVPHLVVTTATP
ncbi:MAG TPA: FAD-dependent monooxygenase, partial [Ktedonobacteraceae bacterium]|nr:FAD-dependent monooxygenase [Ktedonobacteraceae bacterium]